MPTILLYALTHNDTLARSPDESAIEWYEREKQTNQPMVYDRPEVIDRSAENDRKMN